MKAHRPTKFSSLLSGAALVMLATAPGFAGEKSTKKAVEKDPESLFTSAEWGAFQANYKSIPTLNADEAKALKADLVKSADRRIAAKGEFEDRLSADYKTWLRPKIQAVTTGDQLAALIAEFDQIYDKHGIDAQGKKHVDPDVELVMAELSQFGQLRGLVYRLIPIADKSPIAHSALLSFVMEFAAKMRIYFPHRQFRAGFEFLTKPYNGVEQFKTEVDFQRWVVNSLAPRAGVSISRISKLPVDKPIVWDNSILFTNSDIKDDIDRYSFVQKAEKEAMLSAKYAGIAGMYLFGTYRLKGLLDLAVDLKKMSGMDGIRSTFFQLEGVSTEDLVKEIRKHLGIFTVYPNKKVIGHFALEMMKQSMIHLDAAWTSLQGKPKNEMMAINPAIPAAFERTIDLALPTWVSLVNRPTEVHYLLDDKKTVRVDLPSFIENPPDDLKSLLPTVFETGEYLPIDPPVTDSTGKKISRYRNYFKGGSKGWNVAAYSTLFPDLARNAKGPNSALVGDYTRMLIESRGGGMIGWPLSIFVH